jgi:hypothetical protein
MSADSSSRSSARANLKPVFKPLAEKLPRRSARLLAQRKKEWEKGKVENRALQKRKIDALYKYVYSSRHRYGSTQEELESDTYQEAVKQWRFDDILRNRTFFFCPEPETCRNKLHEHLWSPANPLHWGNNI